MVAAAPRLNADDRENLSDLCLLVSAAEGNLRAAIHGDELAQALANAERQLTQALAAASRLRVKFPLPDTPHDRPAKAAGKPVKKAAGKTRKAAGKKAKVTSEKAADQEPASDV